MLGFVTAFFKGLNPKVWLWLIGVAIVATATTTVAMAVKDYNRQWAKMVEEARQSTTIQANMQNKLNFLEEAARRNQQYIMWQRDRVTQRDQELTVLNHQFEVFREVQQEQLKILDPVRLSRLANAKPGLIEIRANRATQKIFDDLEEVFRD